MNQPPRKRYTPEFKTQAVELLEAGRPASQIAEDFCISSSLLYRWRQDAQSSQGGSVGARAVGEGDAADDLRALKREIALLRQENEILKKAAIILGTRPQSNCVK